MAHKKAAGSTRLGRDSNSKRLGVKVFGDQKINAGGIIVRQRGAKYHAGTNVGKGNDDTLFALATGMVKFQEKRVVAFDGNKCQRMYVHVEKTEEQKNIGTKEPKNRRTEEPKNEETKKPVVSTPKDTAKNTVKTGTQKEDKKVEAKKVATAKRTTAKKSPAKKTAKK